MELGINVGYLQRMRNTKEKRDILECAEIVKRAGFKYLDFPLTQFVDEDNWKEIIKRAKEGLDKLGMVVEQTHAPYEFEKYDKDAYKVYMERAFEASKILDAKYIVIHGDTYVPDENGFDFDKALNTVYDFYSPYVEYAKKVDLGVAVENLFDRPDGVRTRFTSTVEEQIALIEKFNDSSVSACWDFGHGKCAYRNEHLNALKKIGSLLKCTHVHDNIYSMDLHQNIFFGDLEWEEIIKYLKESGYKGKFSFEMVYGVIPEPLLDRYMKLFYDTGEYLLSYEE